MQNEATVARASKTALYKKEFKRQFRHTFDGMGFKGHPFYGYNCRDCGIHIATLYGKTEWAGKGYFPRTPRRILVEQKRERKRIDAENMAKYLKTKVAKG